MSVESQRPVSLRPIARFRRGLAIGFVLLLTSVAAVAAFTLAAVSTSHLNLAHRYANSADAMNLAEAAIARSLGEIRADSAYGTRGETLTVQPVPGDDSRRADVTFDPASTLPYSTNNCSGSQGTGHGGIAVPAGTVRLIATGVSRGATQTVEVLVTVPQFPYVVAVTGALDSQGALVVRAASSMSEYAEQEQGAPAAAGSRASLASNTAVRVQQRCEISGDVVCPGTVSLAPDSVVGGVIRASSVEIPSVDPTQWDPTGKAGASRVGPVVNGNLSGLKGSSYSQGDLRVTGDVSLTDGLLYVKGNLTIGGGLSGRGVVVVRGRVDVAKGADLSSSSLVALLADGDVRLAGAPGTRKYFQGLVYSKGRFDASSLSIAGTFVAAGAAMSLRDVDVTHVPEAARIAVTVTNGAPSPLRLFELLGGNYGGINLPYPYAGSFTYDRDNRTGMRYRGSDPGMARMKDSVMAGLTKTFDHADELGRHYRLTKNGSAAYMMLTEGEGNLPDKFEHYSAYLDVGEDVLQARVFLVREGDDKRWLSEAQPIVSCRIRRDGVWSEISMEQADEIARGNGSSLDELVAFSVSRSNTARDAANEYLAGYSGTGTTERIELDLNKFIRDTSPFRVVSWRTR